MTLIERIEAIGNGATINGTYKLRPALSLQAFREDLRVAAVALKAQEQTDEG